MAVTARGPKDGPKKIFGMDNEGWGGPQPASTGNINGDLSSVIDDFSPGTGEMIEDAVTHVYDEMSATVEEYWDNNAVEDIAEEITQRRRPDWLYDEYEQDDYRQKLTNQILDTDIPNQAEVQALTEIEDADPEDWQRSVNDAGFVTHPRATDRYYSRDFDEVDVISRLNVIGASVDRGLRDPDKEPNPARTLHEKILEIADIEDIRAASTVGIRNRGGSRYLSGSLDHSLSLNYVSEVGLDSATEIAKISDTELDQVAETHGLDRGTLREVIDHGLAVRTEMDRKYRDSEEKRSRR